MAAQANNLRARLADGPLNIRGRAASLLLLTLLTALAIYVVHVTSAPASMGDRARQSVASGERAAVSGFWDRGRDRRSADRRGDDGSGWGRGEGRSEGRHGGGAPQQDSAQGVPQGKDQVQNQSEGQGQNSGPGQSYGQDRGQKPGQRGARGKGGSGWGRGKRGSGDGKGKKPCRPKRTPLSGGGSEGSAPSKPGSGGDPSSKPGPGGDSGSKPGSGGPGGGQGSKPGQGGSGGQGGGPGAGPGQGQGQGQGSPTSQAPGSPAAPRTGGDERSVPGGKRKQSSENKSGSGHDSESPSEGRGGADGTTPVAVDGGIGGSGVAGANASLGVAAAAAGAQNGGGPGSGDGSGGESSGDRSGASDESGSRADELKRNAAVSRAVDHVPLGFRLLLLGLLFAVAVLSVVSVRERRRASSVARVAQLDYLTGLANREGFDRMLGQEWRRAIRYGRPLGLVFVDLDHFKAFNDGNGHLAGDRLLREVAAAIGATARGSDFTARLGGDEFVVLCPESSEEGLEKLADRLKTETAALDVTLSVGYALQGPDDLGPEDLVARADAAMYRSKGASRIKASAGNPMLRAMRRPR